MSKYVYAVSSGHYDSYRVHAAYLTKARAKAAVDLLEERYSAGRYYVEAIPLRDELPERVVHHRLSTRVSPDGTATPDPLHTVQEWDIDPLSAPKYPVEARWVRWPEGSITRGWLHVDGYDEERIREVSTEMLELLAENVDGLRDKRSWSRKWKS